MFKVEDLLKGSRGKLISGPGCGRIKSVSTDSRTIKPGDAFIAIQGDKFDGHNFIAGVVKSGARLIIAHKDIFVENKSVTVIRVSDTVKALGDIAAYWRDQFNIPIIAVTGSNGKTTTKDMIAWVLEHKFKVLKNPGTHNNHIGLPQTLLKLDKTYGLAVLEIGTNHFGEVGYLAGICKPDIGVITNIGPSHLEFLKNLNGVYQEKYSLIKKLSGVRVAILNADDQYLAKKLKTRGGSGFSLGAGMSGPCDFRVSSVRVANGKTKFEVNKKYKFTLNTPGSYNIYNAIMAVAAGRIFGLNYKVISARLKIFQFPKSRLNLITVKGITFIDDTYNSNPLSLTAALEALREFKSGGRKIFVMGDMLELGRDSREFHARAVKHALEICDCLITVGERSKEACSGLKSAKKIFSCETPIQAREMLFKDMDFSSEDVVLVKGSRAIALEEVFKI